MSDSLHIVNTSQCLHTVHPAAVAGHKSLEAIWKLRYIATRLLPVTGFSPIRDKGERSEYY